MKRATIARDYGNGLHVEYLPVNQAFLVMWHESRLAGPLTAEDTIGYLWQTMGVKV